MKDFFPNAITIADKFHVLRLLNPAINKARTEITGDKGQIQFVGFSSETGIN
ncbi:MAG: transposase [Bdellovibrionales bacterium]|nr:transposase [Bdellovibrionales bacterium]